MSWLDSILPPLAFLSAIGAGIVAGVFFAFSTFVMSALGRRPPAEGMAAMQAINLTVFNPLFMGLFLGMAGVSAGMIAVVLFRWSAPQSGFLLAGGLAYLIGAFGVTIVGNVPLNEQLARVDPHDVSAEAVWARYLKVWTRWNDVRTAAAVGAMACFILAIKP